MEGFGLGAVTGGLGLAGGTGRGLGTGAGPDMQCQQRNQLYSLRTLYKWEHRRGKKEQKSLMLDTYVCVCVCACVCVCVCVCMCVCMYVRIGMYANA